MTDPFAGVPIVDFQNRPQSLAWLRQKYGRVLTAAWDPSKVRLVRIWETSQAMAAIVSLQDALFLPVMGSLFVFGNGGSFSIPTKANGRAEYIMSGDGRYDPQIQGGPYFLRKADLGITITGWGWPDLTNHDHPNFDFVLTDGHVDPPDPGGGVDPAAKAAILDELSRIAVAVEAARAKVLAL